MKTWTKHLPLFIAALLTAPLRDRFGIIARRTAIGNFDSEVHISLSVDGHGLRNRFTRRKGIEIQCASIYNTAGVVVFAS